MPFIIPVFLPNIGCPHQCVFCNQTVITGITQNIPSPKKLRALIDKFLEYNAKKRTNVQISFFGGNFLGMTPDFIKLMLYEATRFVKSGQVDSIRFSTRPDTIDRNRLDIIKDFPVTTIEIGVQSMNDRVLGMSKRGHTSSDTEKAVNLLKERNYNIGAQMMVGMPGDDEAGALYSGQRIASLCFDFVRIYPTIVLSGSLLAGWHKKGKYIPISLGRCITLVKKLYLLFKEKNITVIRMGLQSSDSLEWNKTILAGPYHPAFGHLVYSEIFLDKARTILKSYGSSFRKVIIKVHQKNISRIRGLKNMNVKILTAEFQIKKLDIIPDNTLGNNALSARVDYY